MKFLFKRLVMIVVIALILSLIVDYCLVVLRNTDPLFIVKEENNTKYGLIYKIVYDDNNVTFYLFNIKLEEKNRLDQGDWFILDKTGKDCNPVKTYFYEDDNYQYYFDCERKYYIKLGEVEYTLKNALENKILTIEELEDTYVKFAKEEKGPNS